MAAPPMTKLTAHFHHVRIGRDELDRLFTVASDGAAAGSVTLMCKPVSTTVEAHTLDDLIAARASLPAVSDRTPWTYLYYKVDELPLRKVELEFSGGTVGAQVEAADSIWAHGQFARIEGILRSSHGTTRKQTLRDMTWQYTILGMLAVTATLIFQLLPRLLDSSVGDAWKNPFTVITWALVVLYACATAWHIRSLRPQFNVLGEVRHGSLWSRLSIPERIGVVANSIAGAALFVALLAVFVGK